VQLVTFTICASITYYRGILHIALWSMRIETT